jgi:DNA-binding transcriptional LysR family regulator
MVRTVFARHRCGKRNTSLVPRGARRHAAIVDRLARLTAYWNWLPAFRVVAETEHLPTAARAMHLSASALSRSVAQLESAIGRKLFERSNRRMVLNRDGAELLLAVRDAMRRVDDGLGRLATGRPASVRVVGEGAWIGLLVAPGLPASVEIEQVELEGIGVRDALLRGLADLVIGETPSSSSDVLNEHLGTVAQAVCAAKSRAPPIYAVCTSATDVWPPEIARTVALRVPRLDAVIAVCGRGGMRAVLPRAIARSTGLRMLSSPHLAPTQLYLLRRPPLAASPIEALVPGIRERARALLR